MIKANDKRVATGAFSTGAPAPAERTDMVMVKALRSFHDGSAMVTDASPPYAAMRHHAEELAAGGLVKIIAAKPKPATAPVPPVPPPGTVDPGAAPLTPPVSPIQPIEPDDDTVEVEDEVELPDDQARRVPDQGQQTASTVPALPGATPIRPEATVLPPAATTEAAPRGRRGRKATRA